MKWSDLFGEAAPWWGPYLGVALCAAVAGLLLAAVFLANLPEILRVLRASFG